PPGISGIQRRLSVSTRRTLGSSGRNGLFRTPCSPASVDPTVLTPDGKSMVVMIVSGPEFAHNGQFEQPSQVPNSRIFFVRLAATRALRATISATDPEPTPRSLGCITTLSIGPPDALWRRDRTDLMSITGMLQPRTDATSLHRVSS